MKHRKSKVRENPGRKLGKNRHNFLDYEWTTEPSRLDAHNFQIMYPRYLIPRIDEPQGRLIYSDNVQTEK